MAKLVLMPKLSVVMREGTIVNWYFKEGDEIKKGDVLYDVEAGKMGGSAEGGLSMENVEAAGVVSASSNAAEAVNALAVLGYSPSDAAAVVGKLDSSLPVEELIRLSLRALAPKWD